MIDPEEDFGAHGGHRSVSGDTAAQSRPCGRMDGVQWSVIVPAKRLAVAKTRLRPVTAGLTDARVAHDELVLALLADTVEAALACSAVDAVLVVTDDPAAERRVRRLGAASVADEPGEGLNPALAHGAARLSGPVAALSSDLPAVRPEEIAAALAAAASAPRAFVADASGRGTTLLAAAGGPLDPRFGDDSAAAHARSGAVPLTGDWPGLRRDVDTASDLQAAVRLGPGRHTTAVLAGLPGPPGTGSTTGD
jgi:2-phospho-L-lactate/phosphoenolpyruvate guanylyltransferase